MARPDAVPSARAGKATPVVVLLLLAIAAAGFYATVPDYFAARDYVARGRCGGVADVTADMVDAWYGRLKEPPVEWPAAADLSTLDVSDTNGVSVVVRLRGGPRRVSAADLVRPDEPL